MTTHNFRIVLAQRRSMRTGRTPAPRLSHAANLLHKITGIERARCDAICNAGIPFKCEFRKIVQYHETMLDYGYRIWTIPKYVQRSEDNDNNILTPTKLKRF